MSNIAEVKYLSSTSDFDEEGFFEYFVRPSVPVIKGLKSWFLQQVFDTYEPVRYNCTETDRKEAFLSALCSHLI